MRTLLDEGFAPITSSIGFLKLPLEEAQLGLEGWRRSLYSEVCVTCPKDGFPEVLRRLEPLTSGARPRELLVSVGEWTAYFDNSLRGTDAVSAIGHLSRRLRCYGLAIRVKPHTIGMQGVRRGRAGSVQFELFGPLPTKFLNYVRTVGVTFDGSRWVFNATGTEQRFEESAAYRKRRLRDRFTSEMLERYCQALGLDVFNPDVYGPDAAFFESTVPMSADGVTMTLAEAQEWAEIEPSMAHLLPG
jgi:hypothetical protein